MEIKYEIVTIKNAGGNGEEHKYVRLQQPIMLTSKEVEAEIEHSSSLTSGDIRAVFAAIHQLLVRELSYGNRVFIPGLGYFTLSAELHEPKNDKEHKITGNDVSFSGINFRPTREINQELASKIRFVKAKTSSTSADYDEADLWDKVEAYLKENRYITTHTMRVTFGLSRYMAGKWIKKFLEDSRLVKSGNWKSPIYFLS